MLKKKIIFLIGGPASGKTTSEEFLVKNGCTSLVSLTTRKKREREIDGVHYHFVDVNEFHSIQKANIIEITKEWYYGIPVSEIIKNADKLIYSVINIQPAIDILNYVKINNINIECYFIIFNIDKKIRIKKLRNRGAGTKEIELRISREDNYGDFEKLYGIKPILTINSFSQNMQKDILEIINLQ
jgi:guanylate kinase